MACTYIINIRNNSQSPQSFMLLQSLRKPDNLPRDEVFTNVYQCSSQISGDGDSSTQFQVANEYWAVIGTGRQNGDGKVRISNSDSSPTRLGPNGSVFVITTRDGGSVCFDPAQAAEQRTAAEGAFTIRSDGSLRGPNNSYIGVGAKDPNSQQIIPIQTYKARPNDQNLLFPCAKFYVAVGRDEPGAIVSMNELGDVLEIDFNNCSIPIATFTLNSNNTYDADGSVTASGIDWRMTRAD